MNPCLPPAIPASHMPAQSITVLNLALGGSSLRQQHHGIGPRLQNRTPQRSVQISTRRSPTRWNLLFTNLVGEYADASGERLNTGQGRLATTAEMNHLDQCISRQLAENSQQFVTRHIDASRAFSVELTIDGS